jgi:hypothetical protein
MDVDAEIEKVHGDKRLLTEGNISSDGKGYRLGVSEKPRYLRRLLRSRKAMGEF